jgi:cell division protein FtsB
MWPASSTERCRVTNRKRQQSIISLSLPKIVAIVTIVLVAILTVDFGRKALDNYHIQRRVEWLREQVVAEQEEHEALQERLVYVSTDAYVEKIARERLKMVRPGDSAVVVIPRSVEQAPATVPVPATEVAEEEPEPNWQQWWNLFFEGSP